MTKPQHTQVLYFHYYVYSVNTIGLHDNEKLVHTFITSILDMQSEHVTVSHKIMPIHIKMKSQPSGGVCHKLFCQTPQE